MKILVVTNLFPPHYIGGYELRCETITNALRARGHEVRVLTSDHGVKPGETTCESGVERQLRVHGFYGHPWLGISALRQLEFHNNRVLCEAVASFRPDVVHVWNLGGISKSLALTLQRLGVPTVYDVSDHWIARSLVGDVWLRWWNRTDAPMLHRLLRAFWTAIGARRRWQKLAPTNPIADIRFSRIYFCSRALLEITRAKGYAVEHGAVIHCPVDIRRFHGEPRTSTESMRKLLYVGRFSEDKGVLTALKAMALVRDQFPGELHLYGRGDADYEAELKRFAESKRLRVEFRSAKSAEMPDVYRQHDALIFTSEWEEPFALTPLEAMACGLPVIGTTTGGSIELLRHGDNALTYSAGDPAELAQRILELDADPVLRSRLAQTGYAEVRERLNEELIVSQIENYLRETIDCWRPVPLPELPQ